MGVSHNAKWWYSTVHLTVAIVGAGVLGFPSAMARLGWWPGMLMLGFWWVLTACTKWQMIQLHEPQGHPRLDTFADLGLLAFPTWGWHFMLALQVIVCVSLDIAYIVTGGYGIQLLLPRLLDKDFRYVLIFGGAQAMVSLFASYSTMTVVNVISTVMGIGYSTIIWGSALKLHPIQDVTVTHHVMRKDFVGKAQAMGMVAFGFGGHNILLEIQATMRSIPQKLSRIPMWNGVVVAYIIVGFCYFPVAAVGYWVFGDLCYHNVLTILLSKSKLQHDLAVLGAVKAAVVMLVIHLTGSYQIYALPTYELLQGFIEMRIRNSSRFSVLVRPVYVAFTCFIAALLPYFNELLGIIGGLVLVPTYFMPSVIWMVVRKPRPLSLSWIANMGCIGFGVGFMFVATIGSLESLLKGFRHKSYQTFKFPQDCNQTSKH